MEARLLSTERGDDGFSGRHGVVHELERIIASYDDELARMGAGTG